MSETATSDVALCGVCGHPMPPGETMFKFHGYSGPCPAPPLPKKPVDIEIVKDKGDNASLNQLARTLRTLRYDSQCFGDLLATLSLSRNRDAIKSGDSAALSQVFDIIDTAREGYNARHASLGDSQ